jgi:hypothetical protein
LLNLCISSILSFYWGCFGVIGWIISFYIITKYLAKRGEKQTSE